MGQYDKMDDTSLQRRVSVYVCERERERNETETSMYSKLLEAG